MSKHVPITIVGSDGLSISVGTAELEIIDGKILVSGILDPEFEYLLDSDHYRKEMSFYSIAARPNLTLVSEPTFPKVKLDESHITRGYN